MPSYTYNYDHKAWTKQCSCCKTIIVGVEDEHESYGIFLKSFSRSNGSADAADGLQSRCWICNSHNRRGLGVTLEWLRDMHERQEGVCGICEVPISLDRGAENPANVDHDDKTGNIRQLLCGNCNRGIGLFFHNVDLLKRAVEYLEFHCEEIPNG